MVEKMTYINPNILIWCRQVSGVSIDEVAQKFKKIKEWENGEDYPTYSQLQQLCDYYRKPIAICFFPEPPKFKCLTTSFRTISAEIGNVIFDRNIIKLIDEARCMQLNLYELNNKTNPRYQLFLEKHFSQSVSLIADELRSYLNADIHYQKQRRSTSEHFEYWRDKLYEIGIYVFKAAFEDISTSGFCLYDDIFPVIYINNTLSYTRQIFTLFHELCHIIHRTSGIDMLNDSLLYANLDEHNLSIEKKCNAFAGAFLVPDSDFQKQIIGKQPTEEFVYQLALSYGVSREVILRKFLDNKKISQEEYNERSSKYTEDYFRVKDNINSNGGGNYYNNQAAYKGRQYIELVFRNYYANKISLAQAARYMNMKIPSIRVFAEKKGWGSI